MPKMAETPEHDKALVREWPVSFIGPMVRAILAGHKN